MYDPRVYQDYNTVMRRRHNPGKLGPLWASLVSFVSALVFALAIFGWLDAEAQMWGYSLPNGMGGYNYFYNTDPSAQWLQLGTQALWMGNQAQMQRRQLNAQYGWVQQPHRQVNPRQLQSPDGSLPVYPEW